jgi:hypothetical protein
MEVLIWPYKSMAKLLFFFSLKLHRRTFYLAKSFIELFLPLVTHFIYPYYIKIINFSSTTTDSVYSVCMSFEIRRCLIFVNEKMATVAMGVRTKIANLSSLIYRACIRYLANIANIFLVFKSQWGSFLRLKIKHIGSLSCQPLWRFVLNYFTTCNILSKLYCTHVVKG